MSHPPGQLQSLGCECLHGYDGDLPALPEDSTRHGDQGTALGSRCLRRQQHFGVRLGVVHVRLMTATGQKEASLRPATMRVAVF